MRPANLIRLALAAFGLATLTGEAPTATNVRPIILPYAEIDQTAYTDLSGGGDHDVLTYTEVVAGVDASLQSRRVSAQLDFEYRRYIPESGHGRDGESDFNGLLQGQATVAPGLTIEGGALATRVRSDIRDRPSGLDLPGDNGLEQAFAAYVGPTFSKDLGDVHVGATYRLAYVRVDDDSGVTLPGDRDPTGSYGSSWNQAAGAQVGMRPETLFPFGWTVSGGWTHESVGELSQRFTDEFVRLDLIQPVAPTLAIQAGVGDESTRISQRAPLIGSDGLPVLDKHGHYQPDPHTPRLKAYDVTGLIYDVGVTWRPSRRTSVQVTAGYQYGGTFVTAAASWQVNPSMSFQAGVFNAVTSFGQLLTVDLSGLPTQFQVHRTGLGNSFSGCVYGTNGAGSGCLTDALQSAATSDFHNRGAFATLSGGVGPWNWGVSANYTRRNYLGGSALTALPLGRATDQSVDLRAEVNRKLSERSSIEFDSYADWYKSGLAGSPTNRLVGADASLLYNFGYHLSGTVAVGLENSAGDQFSSDWSGSLLLGVRYQF